ncbi:kinesin-domain-containing protein [Aureobasidium subglaciale]|nr:kinesin-domain-containing protein [Aureobasidium subglaciale]
MVPNGENAQPVRASGLRPPSRIPATSGLLEMSASDNNARAIPPPANLLKHKGSALPEPAPKRKTLAERAGEPARSTHTTSRVVKRSNTTNALRKAPGTQAASSVRPASAAATHRNNSALPRTGSRSALAARPVSVTQEDDDEDSSSSSILPNKRKGMLLSPIIESYALILQQPRTGDKVASYASALSRAPTAGDSPTPLSSSYPKKFAFSAYRNTSLSTAFRTLSLSSNNSDSRSVSLSSAPQEEPLCPKTPSQIPKPKPAPKTPCPPEPDLQLHIFKTPHTKYTVYNASPGKITYLNRYSNTPAPAWDTKGRLEDMETLYSQLKSQLDSAATEKTGMEEGISIYKARITEMEQVRLQLSAANQTLSTELAETKVKLSSTNAQLDDMKRSHSFEIDDLRRKNRNDVEDAKDDHRKEIERLQREARDELDRVRKDAQEEADRANKTRREELADKERELRAELEEERARRLREVQELTTQFSLQKLTADNDVTSKDRELQSLRSELNDVKANLESSNALNASLKEKLTEASTSTLTLETSMRAMKAKIDFLESDNQAQSQAFQDLNQQMLDAQAVAAEAKEKLRQEETLRRKLHNQVQELKGNIRVFCRVRPALGDEETKTAELAFPDADTDSKEVVVQGPDQKSAMGTVTKANNNFSFDRVFGPSSQNGEIFDEISQLVQSALDGYNVCIFCYGQTGSGKTHTMSASDGMIPSAVTQIYETAKSLEDKGWTYSMEGSFVEVYNETVNDLLGKAEDWNNKKHEIRQDPVKLKTTITDVTTVNLDSPSRVNAILDQANRNRRVAATQANSRSSRSHSVFILRLIGENSMTGERSEGTLNLVDLAGSERLAHSQVSGDRLKETQNINKSLSCLGDVISALGSGKDAKHIPYRNSKLTYLLQYSLGGNSKTLMFVMVSPLQAHLSETLTSLKFATKVHNTHIGTAKRQAKVKD